jgi:hypothetical protein
VELRQRYGWIDRHDRLTNTVTKARRIHRRPNGEVDRTAGLIRQVHGRVRLAAHVVVKAAARDAHDLAGIAVLRRQAEAPSDRVFVREVPLHEGLVDDDGAGVGAEIVGHDRAAGEDWDVQGLEEAVGDVVHVRSMVVVHLASRKIDASVVAAAGQQPRLNRGDGGNAGQPRQGFAYLVRVLPDALGRIGGPRGTDRGVGHVLAVEADVRRFQLLQRAAEQAGGDQRGQTQRKLHRHQQPRQAQAPADHRSGLRLERVAEVGAGRADRRRKAEQERGEHGERAAESEHAQVDVEIEGVARVAAGLKQEVNAASQLIPQRETDDAAEHGAHRAFDEVLAEQAQA